jgi:hypothetical protein
VIWKSTRFTCDNAPPLEFGNQLRMIRTKITKVYREMSWEIMGGFLLHSTRRWGDVLAD